jgi:solute carrier family 35 protein F1/2
MHGIMPSTAVPYKFLNLFPIQAPVWVYFIMAVLDVYASYFQVSAYHYTTITSVALLSALAIPSTMILSYTFLGRRYTTLHLAGVGLSLLGILCNVMQDLLDDKHAVAVDENDGEYPHKLRGDLLAIAGGFLYGASEVMGELVVRKLGGPAEYLGMMGFFGAVICFIQAAVLERKEIEAFANAECSQQTAAWLLIAFVASNFASYVSAAKFFQISEATFFNLSLQTGGLWSVGFSVLAQHIIPQPLFYVALLVTVSGVIIYEMAPTPIVEEREMHKMMRSTSSTTPLTNGSSDANGVVDPKVLRSRRGPRATSTSTADSKTKMTN